MEKILFVTSNKNKLSELQDILKNENNFIDFIKNVDLNLTEIQSNDVEQIAIQKCKDAYKVLNKPYQENFIWKFTNPDILVEDTSFEIDCLNGMPGPFTKYFDTNVLYKMVENFEDKTATVKCVFALKTKTNPSEIKTFTGSIKGKVVAPRGNNGFGLDVIFQPENEFKTFAEMTTEEKNKISHRKIAIDKFKNFLKT